VNEGYVYGGGNGYWIEHADGTRAEYAHMFPGSVPSDLCPHDAELLPAKISSPDVSKAWPYIRVTNGKQVAEGQFLGRVGNVGTSSDPHPHPEWKSFCADSAGLPPEAAARHAVFVKGEPDILMRHGSPRRSTMPRWRMRRAGSPAVNISVVSIDGQRSYTVPIAREDRRGSSSPRSMRASIARVRRAEGRAAPISLDATCRAASPSSPPFA
jgi:hypothetical protein